jgi:hypothetical protein
MRNVFLDDTVQACATVRDTSLLLYDETDPPCYGETDARGDGRGSS